MIALELCLVEKTIVKFNQSLVNGRMYKFKANIEQAKILAILYLPLAPLIGFRMCDQLGLECVYDFRSKFSSTKSLQHTVQDTCISDFFHFNCRLTNTNL